MASQWKLTADDITVKVNRPSVITGEMIESYDHVQEYVGSYKDCVSKAAHIRWVWISTNSYNPIRVIRTKNKITYIVLPHFGMPQYTLATIERN